MISFPHFPGTASTSLAGYLFLCCLLPGVSVGATKGKSKGNAESRSTEEVFRVSRVGQRGAAETRELLELLYRDAAASYDTGLKAELAKKDSTAALEGEKIRVIRKLKQNNPDGNLYLCAYNGTPSVFRISGKAKLQGGKLSPPLNQISKEGEHTTEITRVFVEPSATGGNQPALEKVDTGSGVTFFGIPMDSGPAKKPAASPSPKAEELPKKREVTEIQTLPLYSASISTVKREKAPPMMSRELFLKMLKNGEVFSVEKLEERRCQNCRGFGKISDTRPPGSRSPDGKMPCPECMAGGKIPWQVTYQVGW